MAGAGVVEIREGAAPGGWSLKCVDSMRVNNYLQDFMAWKK
jgi:hypothetical protein